MEVKLRRSARCTNKVPKVTVRRSSRLAAKRAMQEAASKEMSEDRFMIETAVEAMCRRNFYKDLMQLIRDRGDQKLDLFLKENDARPNPYDLNVVVKDTTPLLYAISEGTDVKVITLIHYRANVNWIASGIRRITPDFPLNHAVLQKAVEPALILLQAGADVNNANYFDNTPLWLATLLRCPTMITMMMMFGAAIKPNLLHCEGTRFIYMTLLAEGVAVKYCCRDSYALLYWAFHNDEKCFAAMVIDCGARLTAEDWARMPASLIEKLENEPEYYEWLKMRMSEPLSLQCQAANVIRMHLSKIHRKRIGNVMATLLLPKPILENLNMQRYFEQLSATFDNVDAYCWQISDSHFEWFLQSRRAVVM